MSTKRRPGLKHYGGLVDGVQHVTFALFTGMHHSVRDIAGGDQHHAGHGTVQPVPRNPHRGHDDQQHGPDNDRGQRGNMRHGPDRRRRVHSGQQAPRQEAANAAQLGRVRPPGQGRHPCRHPAGELLRRAERRADVVAGSPERVQRP